MLVLQQMQCNAPTAMCSMLIRQSMPTDRTHVAGEYPMTGTSAAEKEIPGSRADKLHRGRNVVLAFTMQVSLSPCGVRGLLSS